MFVTSARTFFTVSALVPTFQWKLPREHKKSLNPAHPAVYGDINTLPTMQSEGCVGGFGLQLFLFRAVLNSTNFFYIAMPDISMSARRKREFLFTDLFLKEIANFQRSGEKSARLFAEKRCKTIYAGKCSHLCFTKDSFSSHNI